MLGPSQAKTLAMLAFMAFFILDAITSGLRADCDGVGEPDVVVRACTSIIERGQPESVENCAKPYLHRGDAHRRKRNFDAAIVDYAKVIEVCPNLAKFYDRRGAAYLQKGELNRAIVDFAKARESRSFKYLVQTWVHAEAHRKRGISYREKGEIRRALYDFNKAIELYPKYAVGFSDRGVAHEMMDQRDKAIADFRMAVEIDPDDKTGSAGLARLGAAR